jgi:uncharacterized phage infection (PIP) family protein YhgE
VRRDFDEIKAMQIEETQRIYYDSQYYKDKVDKLKSELAALKKVNKLNERYKELYEEIKTREDMREQAMIKEKTIQEIKKQQERYSFLGHLKVLDQKNSKASLFT